MTAEERRTKLANARRRETRRLGRLHRYEDRIWLEGSLTIGGVDEVGRGPLAGPVVAACVVATKPLRLVGLNDSKVVKREDRERLAGEIKATALAWAIGEASVEEIERLNIYWASVLAMERAIAAIGTAPDFLLTDAVRIRSYGGAQEPVIDGDAKCATIAAASIVAKVHRDAMLVALHDEFPQYGFEQHKGYATRQHLAALETYGPCAHHRRGFWRVDAAMLPGFGR